MFSFFRRGATAKIMLAFLGLALFAMVVTGFGTGGSGIGDLAGGGSTLAEVGDERLTATELTDQLNRQLTQARQQQPELDMGSLLRTGAFEEAIRGLITGKALLSFGHDIGLAASKLMVDREIASIPAFQNLAGQFDNAAFQAALARENISEKALRDELAASIIQRQLLLPIAANTQVPEGFALQYASLLLERRTGSVGVVPAEAMPAGAPPTAAEIQTFYNQNKARYTIPERRVLRYAMIGADKVAAASQPSDQEVQAYYQSNAARYAAQETRDLSQVVLPTQQAAQQFLAKLKSGTSFQQAAAEAGFSAGDTRQAGQTKSAFAGISSPAVADAAFTAAEGTVTEPVRSDFGWHIIRVDAVNSTPAKPLESVRGEIVEQLTHQKTQDALADLITRIEDSIADGATLQEVAQANGLQLQESPPVTAAGAGATSPEIAPLLKTAFDMTEDEDAVVETIQQGERYALLAVARIVPAAPPPLAQIADRVRADLIAQRQQNRARQVAAAIVAKINAGTSPAEAFAQAGVSLPPLQAVDARRMEISQGGQVPPPLQMLFSMKRGTAKVLEAPNGAGWFVVHLASTEAGDAKGNPALVQATRAQFSQVIGEEYAQQFARAVESKLDVERNEDAIKALKDQLAGPGAQ